MKSPIDLRVIELLNNGTNESIKIFMRDHKDISENDDFLLMGKISQTIKEFADVLLLLTIAIHYRYEKKYTAKIVEILSDIKLEHEIWLQILKYKETWYFQFSESIEIITIKRCLETAPRNKTAAAIYDYCLTARNISKERLEKAVAKACISKKRRKIIISSRATVEKIIG